MKISLRTCIACRTIRKKENLIRLVVDEKSQVRIDKSGKSLGRGAYVCNRTCFGKAVNENLFNRAFKRKVNISSFESLISNF